MYLQFNSKQLHVLPTHCIYVFCVHLSTNDDYFSLQHNLFVFIIEAENIYWKLRTGYLFQKDSFSCLVG